MKNKALILAAVLALCSPAIVLADGDDSGAFNGALRQKFGADVKVRAHAAGAVLTFDGVSWIASTVSVGAGGSVDASNLTGILALNHGGTGLDTSTVTNGQILIGNTTGNVFALHTLAAGTGMSVTNGTGTITLAISAPVSVANGGTGITSYAVGDLLYASGSTTLSKLSAGTNGYVLTSQGASAAPIWQIAAGAGSSPWVSSSNVTSLATGSDSVLIQSGILFGGSASGAVTVFNCNRQPFTTAILNSTYPAIAFGQVLSHMGMELWDTSGARTSSVEFLPAGGIGINTGQLGTPTVSIKLAANNDLQLVSGRNVNISTDGMAYMGGSSVTTNVLSLNRDPTTPAILDTSNPAVDFIALNSTLGFEYFNSDNSNNNTTFFLSGGGWAWAHGGSIGSSPNAGISWAAASTLAIGNGTAGDTTGTARLGSVRHTTSSGFIEAVDQSSAAVSASGEGRIRYNNTGHVWEASTNGGAYATLGGAPSLPLSLANGGTGIDTSAVTNGQILIGNTTGHVFALATLAGTSNEITVTNGGSTITLATPQAIGTGSSPTFAGLTLSSPLSAANGGTGISSYTTGDLLVATGSTALGKIAIGASGKVLASNGTTASWQNPPLTYLTAAQSSVDTTTSGTYVEAVGMDVSPTVAGTYLVIFSGSVSNSGTNITGVEIMSDSTDIATSVVQLNPASANVHSTFCCQAVVAQTGSNTIKGMYQAAAGTSTIYARTLTVIYLGP